MKRDSSYLDTRGPSILGDAVGKINVTTAAPSIRARQISFAKEQKYKKMANNPKSEDLEKEGFSNVVKGLETHFDPWETKIIENDFVKPAMDSGTLYQTVDLNNTLYSTTKLTPPTSNLHP